MRLRNYIIGGLCSAVIVAQGASTPGGNDPAVGDDGLDVVPEENLKEMRGGVDLGNLVGYFAINRVVEVDGQVVAKMQIVVSNLDKISTGGMPTVTVSGPLSELVQVMNGPAGSSGAEGVAAAVAAAARSTEASRGNSGTSAVNTGTTLSGSNGSAGSAASGGTSGLAGQAAGASYTVNVGNGNTTVPATGGASTAVSAVQGAAGSASGGTSSGSGGSGQSGTAETINKVIPIGNSGQYVVVSNLPSSAGLATAIQNEVRGTTVQVQTTITAQLNSLTMLNSAALANALHQVSLTLPTGTTGH
jgi:hypothetical protein